ncbi:MAG: hypothetical protein RLZZ299_2299 [Pseudomonadota bacterium]
MSHALAARCATALSALGVDAACEDDALVVGLPGGPRARRPWMALPRGVSRAGVAALAARVGPAVVVLPHAPPAVAEALVDAGVAFIDEAGNASIDAPGLVVRVLGRKPASRVRRGPPPMRAGGLQLLFVLLTDPNAPRMPYRELAARAGVALGTVSNTVAALREDGRLVVGPGGALLPRDASELGRAWDQAWADTLRPSLLLGRARPLGGLGLDALRAACARTDGVLFGGAAGAHLLLGAPVPADAPLTLHVPMDWTSALRALRLAPDPAGPVHVLARAHPAEAGETLADGIVTPHARLLRAEVLALGDASLARLLA